jgi:hypothetical protein
MSPFEGVDRHPTRLALAQKTLRGIESSEVVKHPGQPRAPRVFPMPLRQAIRQASHAHGVGETMILINVCPDGARERDEVQRLPAT